MLTRIVYALVFLLGSSAFVKTSAHATSPDEQQSHERQILEAQFSVGANWIYDVIQGNHVNSAEVDTLKQYGRLVPFGATDPNTGLRTESLLFRIEASKDRLILLKPEPGRLQVLIGAPVTEEVMSLAQRNSIYLFDESTPGNEKFLDVVVLVAKNDQVMKSEFGLSAFADNKTQEAFNRMVLRLGDKAASYLELNTKMTAEQIRFFISAINGSICENSLTSVLQNLNSKESK